MLRFNGKLSFGYRQLEIEVSPAANSISLQGHTLKKAILYGYLYDPKQKLRGQILLQEHRKQFAICADKASPGSIAGEIEPGTWLLHLYNLEGAHGQNSPPIAYHIEIDFEQIPVESELKTEPVLKDGLNCFDFSKKICATAKWYRGDLHAHTQLSHGHNTLEQAVALIELQQLDFIFLTEHNIHHTFLPVSEQTLFVPGIEITTGLGHFNVHGPRRTLEMQEADFTGESLIEAGLALGGEQGHIAMNHAMMKPWHWQYQRLPLAKIHSLEICCDPTWPTSAKATEKVLMAMTALWNRGRRIYGVGGSDCHLQPDERNPKATEPSIYGDPATCVYCHDGLSGEALLQSLRKGHVYIERRCNLQFCINRGEQYPGNDVGAQTLIYTISVGDRQQQYDAEFVADGEIIAKIPLSNQAINYQVDMSRYRWLRVDIRRKNGDFEGLINPVFNGEHPCFASPLIHTWGQLMAVITKNATAF
jgi:hypothetical protein